METIANQVEVKLRCCNALVYNKRVAGQLQFNLQIKHNKRDRDFETGSFTSPAAVIAHFKDGTTQLYTPEMFTDVVDTAFILPEHPSGWMAYKIVYSRREYHFYPYLQTWKEEDE